MAYPKNGPPRWVRKFLRIFLDPRILEASLGDLEEKFIYKLRDGMPLWKARLHYVLEGLGFLKLASRTKIASRQSMVGLLSHTLLFFSRLVRKDRSYYLVSLLGLTISISSFLLIMMYIRDEMAFDQFHENKSRLFRLNTRLKLGDVEHNHAKSAFPAAQALASEIEAVEATVRIFPQNPEFSLADQKSQEHVILADSKFFEVFTFPLLSGDPKTVLADPSNIVLTETMAKKYFGTANPIGKSLDLFGNPMVVSGVAMDVPEHSHIRFKAVIPLAFQLNLWKAETGIEGRENKWFWIGSYTYVLLKDGTDASALRPGLSGVVDKYFPERYKAGGSLDLQLVTDIHLTPNLNSEIEPGGNILYVQLFSVVAFVIMLVSAINLVNLSYFKIASRVREVGIRKFLGQGAGRIAAQLSIESIIIGMVAFILAIVVCQMTLGEFNGLVHKDLKFWSLPNRLITLLTFVAIVAICIIAVIRPAVRYAGQSANRLMENYRNNSRARLRNFLIGLQVCFSFVLLAFSFIIGSQVEFFRNKDLGFDKNNIIVVHLKGDVYKKIDPLRDELRKSSFVLSASGGDSPGHSYNGYRFVPEGGPYEKPFLFGFTTCDDSYISTLGLELLQGRNFSKERERDTVAEYMLNEKAVADLGWTDPVNRKLEVFAPGTTEIMQKGIVVGILADYNFESLHNPVKPIVLTNQAYFDTFLVKISGDRYQEAILAIENIWKKFSAEPFDFEVLDQKMDNLYDREAQLSHVILFFTVIALYLTCYGLFAMSSLLFSSKLKEVVIRKVFGAGVRAIVQQLYSRYVVFNVIAIIAGIPVAFYLGNLWLQTFQYRITLDSSPFLKAGACILLAGLVSVSYYLARVAFSNPVKYLRRE